MIKAARVAFIIAKNPHIIPPKRSYLPADLSHTNQPERDHHASSKFFDSRCSYCTATLTSEGLEPVKQLLITAQDERARLLPELREAANEAARLGSKHERCKNGWLFRRLFKGYFARLGEMSMEATDKKAELQEQERLSRLATEFDLPQNLKDTFGQVCDAAAMLSRSQRIWDTLSSTATDRYCERTTASHSVQRKPVAISLGSSDLIETSWKVPHLMNANGGEMFIYPAFILYHVSHEAFALVDIRDANLYYTPTSFIEEEAIPTDAQIDRSHLEESQQGRIYRSAIC